MLQSYLLISCCSSLPECLLIFLVYLFVIVAAVLSINDKHALLVNMPTISTFGIDGNPE
jgi:hypothetical protein